MNSPNNLLFDSEMATSRLRKAFESAPESDLDGANIGYPPLARRLPGALHPICYLLFAICYS
jgi:hypothetical protein